VLFIPDFDFSCSSQLSTLSHSLSNLILTVKAESNILISVFLLVVVVFLRKFSKGESESRKRKVRGTTKYMNRNNTHNYKESTHTIERKYKPVRKVRCIYTYIILLMPYIFIYIYLWSIVFLHVDSLECITIDQKHIYCLLPLSLYNIYNSDCGYK